MTSSNTVDVMARQRLWAARTGRVVDARGYLPDVDANFRQPLSARARADFEAGDGAELVDGESSPAKMRSLISSSALAANVFDYWSGRDLAPILRALGVNGRATEMWFERKLPTGARGKSPNLDVVLALDDGRLLGIESKFTEWMTPKSGMKTSLAPYISDEVSRWSRAPMAAADRLARAVHDGAEKYQHLDVPQLLKHALGLAKASQGGWALHYLYFDGQGEAAQGHAEEIERFTAAVGEEMTFAAWSYQSFVVALRQAVKDEHTEYFAYLRDRYVGPPAA